MNIEYINSMRSEGIEENNQSESKRDLIARSVLS